MRLPYCATINTPQAPQKPIDPMFYVWLGVLVIVVVLLFAVVIWIKKWLGADVQSGGGELTLSDLRQLVRQGKMTPEEFDKAKAQIVRISQAKLLEPEKKPPAGDDFPSIHLK